MKMTYAEILIQAKMINPQAGLRFVPETSAWEIILPSEARSVEILPDVYRGTPAYRAFYATLNTLSPNYETELEKWAYRKGYSDKPLEFIADYYNLAQYENAECSIYLSDLDKEAGIASLEWDDYTNEDFARMKSNRRKANSMVDQSARKALDEKWSALEK